MTLCSEYYHGIITEGIFSMHSKEIIDHLGKIYESVVVNNQNKMRFYSRNENELLKNKQDEL